MRVAEGEVAGEVGGEDGADGGGDGWEPELTKVKDPVGEGGAECMDDAEPAELTLDVDVELWLDPEGDGDLDLGRRD